MNQDQTAEIVQLQQRIAARLAELGYADLISANNLSRQIASIAVLGKSFSQTTLPLFLTLDRDHAGPIGQLAISMKCDLEEIGDAIADSDVDLRSLMEFLNPKQSNV